MNPALFSAAAGMSDKAQKMETIVHNLANVNTTAYKRHVALSVPFTRFLDEELTDVKGTGGEMFAKQHIRFNYCDGLLKYTGRNLDVALQQQGPVSKDETCAFFTVKANPRPVSRPRQFRVDEDNFIVEAVGPRGDENGQRAININGQPIQLPPNVRGDQVQISPEGLVAIVDDKGVQNLYDQIRDPVVVAELDPGLQYTRNGNFHLQLDRDKAYLVTVDGYRIQGQNGDISFDKNITTNEITIDPQGRIFIPQEGKEGLKQVDQLKIASMKDVPFAGKLKFQVDENDFVVNARGRPIIDVRGAFILAPSGTSDIEVDEKGRVLADGKEIGLTYERPGEIRRGEDEPLVSQTRLGYYVPTDEFVQVEGAKNYELFQCNLESSNVSVIQELGDMILTMRGYEADAKMLQTMEQNLRMVTNAQPVR